MLHECTFLYAYDMCMREYACTHMHTSGKSEIYTTHTHTHTHVSVQGTARMSASNLFFFSFFYDSAHGTAPMSASKFARRRNSLTDGGDFPTARVLHLTSTRYLQILFINTNFVHTGCVHEFRTHSFRVFSVHEGGGGV